MHEFALFRAKSVGPPCRWLIADGDHPKAIQTRLGHGSISVTMDRYGHLMDGLDDQIAVHLDTRTEAVAPPARPEIILSSRLDVEPVVLHEDCDATAHPERTPRDVTLVR